MTAPAAFKASYADWKLIRSRKCVQIVFEVPLEAADAAYQVVGGMPDVGGSDWFAIARLAPETEKPVEPKKERAKQNWHDMSPAQQAGVLCADTKFQKFIGEMYRHITINTEEAAATAVRDQCGVLSRSEIDNFPTARARWIDLVSRYRAWERAPGVGA